MRTSLLPLAEQEMLLGNACGGGSAHQEAVWARCLPATFPELAAVSPLLLADAGLRADALHEPLAMVLYTCCRESGDRCKELCHGPGARCLAALLSGAGKESVSDGAGTWLQLLVGALCLQRPLLSDLIAGLAAQAAAKAAVDTVGDECLAPVDVMTEEQASLLTILAVLVDEKSHQNEAALPQSLGSEPAVATATDCRRPTADWVGPLQLLPVIADLFAQAAAAVRERQQRGGSTLTSTNPTNAGPPAPRLASDSARGSDLGGLEVGGADPFAAVLACSLQLLRSLTAGAAASSDATEVLGSVLNRVLDALEALPQPLPATLRATEVRGGMAEAPTARIANAGSASSAYPVVEPYSGYRTGLVAVICNAVYRRPLCQDEVRRRGKLLLVLQQCVVDDRNPWLREWGLFAMRNLLEGSDANACEVSALTFQGVADNQQLRELGWEVQLEPATGKPRLVHASSS
eukprot:SM000287S10627  [mRNA]  locus=s287:43577:46052:- [translate_table: standard]